MKNGQAIRDGLMFVLGAAAFLHEVFLGAIERPYILAAACALMGLPFVLRGDELLKRRNGRRK